jgi:shikimate kinase
VAKHIALVGMMGSGKSTVAPILAAQLNRPVIEVDALIEEREGMPIGEIFMEKGEAYFRRLESDVIVRLIATPPPAVLSMGGGAFQWETTRQLLLQYSIVFYLATGATVLANRLRAGTAARPLISTPGLDLDETVRDLLTLREAHYRQAHYRVETDSHSPEDVAKSIVMMREAYE